MVTSVSNMVLAPFVGSIIDRTPRLRLVSVSVWCQKWSIAFSSLILLAKLGFSFKNDLVLDGNQQPNDWYFILTVTNGAFLTVCNTISRIAIERDWSSCIAKSSNGVIPLAHLNSRLRFIDLVCDLIAPLVISFIVSIWNIQMAMVFVIGVSCLSSFLEIPFIHLVYRHFNSLAEKEPAPSSAVPIEGITETESIWEKCKRIAKLPIFTTCISISMLYLTVLTLNTLMISYLIFKNVPIFAISMVRGISVLCGISSSLTYEPLVHRFGTANVGLSAVWFQIFNLTITITSIHLSWGNYLDSKSYLCIFLSALCLSRWGLWTFDMAQQQLLQESVQNSDLGFVSGSEISLQNFFTITTYFITAVYDKPESFEGVPMHVSFCSVLLGGLMFSYYYLFYGNQSSKEDEDEIEPLLNENMDA